MPCYHPIKGWRARDGSVTFAKNRSLRIPATVKCGQCIGCRLDRSGAWALRCIQESQLYENNCFITLTYDDKNLPNGGTLEKRHFQLFMKRLRKKYGSQIRFYMCGEYGEQFGRPHYHACIFNHDFEDKEAFKQTETGFVIYTSKELETIWPFGFSSVGDLTFETAAYTARYILKKITGDSADDHYQKTDIRTGEVVQVQPEYTTMSRRPGIGRQWYEKYKEDAYPSDFLTHKGKKLPIPKYYDSLFERSSPEDFERIKDSRMAKLKLRRKDLSPERLRAREQVKLAQISQLKRNLT